MRTVYTNTQNFMVLMWWIGSLVVARVQKDKPTMVAGSLLSIGFAIAFALSATWCLGYEFAPKYIDWWKMWELTAGFLLGCLYVVVLNWANGEVDKAHGLDGTPIPAPRTETTPGIRQEQYRGICLILTAASLLYILFRGGSLQLGGFLGFYDTTKIDQYSWPTARIVIFAPIALLIVAIASLKIRHHMRLAQMGQRQAFLVRNLHEKITALIVLITVVGIVTIWPSKIGVLYATLLWVAIVAINRLDYHYDQICSVSKN